MRFGIFQRLELREAFRPPVELVPDPDDFFLLAFGFCAFFLTLAFFLFANFLALILPTFFCRLWNLFQDQCLRKIRKEWRAVSLSSSVLHLAGQTDTSRSQRVVQFSNLQSL